MLMNAHFDKRSAILSSGSNFRFRLAAGEHVQRRNKRKALKRGINRLLFLPGIYSYGVQESSPFVIRNEVETR